MRTLLIASLLLNLALVVGWLLQGRNSPANSKPLIEAAKASAETVPTVAIPPPPAPSRIKPWEQIASESPAELMARLKEVGCPEETIRDIVVMQICRNYRARMIEAESRASRDWNPTRSPDAKTWRERNRHRRELREQMITEIENITGQPWFEVRNSVLGWPRTSSSPDFVTLEKRQQIRRIELQYSEQMQEIQGRVLGVGWDPDSHAQYRKLQIEQDKAIAALLTPTENQEYVFRSSAAADYVRQNLPEAKTEQEFRAMVQAATDLGVYHEPRSMAGRYGLDGDAEDPEAKAKQIQLNQRLEEILGPERIAELKREEEARIEEEQRAAKARRHAAERAQMQTVASSVGINEEAAGRFFDRVHELQPELDAKFKDMERMLTGTPSEKARIMQQAVRSELEAIAKDTVGEKSAALLDKLMPR